ncbi:transcriptional regulator [Solibacillus sp. FSL R7-0668]|uniref:transcriptional regulator n=1 Tax=Solibacillus sp. FSL R7-0668 TaxID=2921688 RepID=UPI0030F8633A
MTMFQQGYQVYVKKCEQFGLEPVNFRYYVMQLSSEQLQAYNTYASEMEMEIE